MLTVPVSSKPRGSAWAVYSRLMRYAWNYKARLVVALTFALVIAASFGVMLVSVGTVIQLAYYKPVTAEELVAGAKPKVDPAETVSAKIEEYSAKMRELVHWAPQGVEPKFRALVAEMRDENNKMRTLYILCGTLLTLASFVAVARYIQEYFAGSIGAGITTDLENEMFGNVIGQSVAFFESHASGEIMARFTNDCFMVSRGLSDVFVKLMREPFKALVLLYVAIRVDAWLALLGICVLPPVFYILILLGKKMRRATRRSLQRIAGLVSVIGEVFGGIQIVKGYNMERYESERVREGLAKLRKYLLRVVRIDATTGPLTEFLLLCGLVVFILVSGRRVQDGYLEASQLVELYGALALALDPIRKLSAVNNMLQTSIASAERVFEFIDLKPSIVEAAEPVELKPLRESIRFEDVHFSYDGQHEVLCGVDLEIRKGELVALVGFSGAGKSTLVKLLPRFYDVTKGVLAIDGIDIRKGSFESLRDQISIVTQDTILFAESVRDNIAFGSKAYSDERVREAAIAAHADEFIQRLPEGYDTVLGESGCTLSGGQRQRLAIARAIIKDPAILILDEATSSLDSESERLIQNALDRFISGRTAIVIAHRLSTVQRADRIVVMDQGRVAQQGTHAELLAAGGIYKRLYDTQFGLTPEGQA